jgi:xylose isomerase
MLSIEPKPNEPRGDMYLATTGHALAFIETLEHPLMVGVNPEFAHVKMAGLNPYHEYAQALEVGKLLDVHMNGQKIGRFDQDMSIGADGIKDVFFVVKLLKDYQYKGTVAIDAHPFRTENDPWEFVDRCMRTYKMLAAKVDRLNADKEYRKLMQPLVTQKGPLAAALAAGYDSATLKTLRGHKYAPEKLAVRDLPYERIDQILTEVLLGVR